MDIRAWLERLGLAQYAGAFADNHIDAAMLRGLTGEDLKELGVASLGHRKKLLEAIAALEREPAPQAPAADAQTQRRQVTVLFADICGFTELSRQLDAEDLHRLCQRFYALADAAIADAGGTVDKHLGDGVMALFGAPVAHGDDALRAMRAAEALHEAMALLADETGRMLQLHIGIAAGEVIAGGLGSEGNRQYTALGDSVNLAARLVALAEPGQTVVSDQARLAAGKKARFEALGEHAIKGIAQKLPLWRLTGLQSGGDGARGPFVGRVAEREQLEAVLRAVPASGAGRIVLLRGEPGIGKTRLVEELRRYALTSGYVAATAHVLDFGSGRRGTALRQLMRQVLELPEQAEQSQIVSRLDAAGVESALGIAAACYLLDCGMPAEAQTAWQAASEGARLAAGHDVLAHLTARASERMPLLAVIEDLHWADEETLQGIARLARVAGERPLAMLMTTRGEGDPLERGLREGLLGLPFTLIDLSPLRDEEALTLAGQLAGLGGETVRNCLERAGGNPLFLEQLLRNAAEAGGEELPGSLRSLVLARLDRLPVHEQEILQAAAALGQRFDAAALAAVLERGEVQPQEALRAGLLRTEGATLAFTHALIREGIYLSLLRERRAALHRRAAQWYGSRDALLCAEHLELAGDAAAPAAYLGAAGLERAAYRPRQAASLAERGLALTPDAAVLAKLLLMKAEALLDACQARAAQDTFTLALSAVETEVDQFEALIGLAGARRIIDDLKGALASLDQAQTIAELGAMVEPLSRIHHLRGNILFPLGRADECTAEQKKGLEYAERSGSTEAVARSLGGLGDALYARGDMMQARDVFQRCVDIAHQAGLGRIEVANRPMLALGHFFALDLERGKREAHEALRQARRVGQRRAELIALHGCMQSHTELGEFDSVWPLGEQAQEIVAELGAFRFEPENLIFLADAFERAGRKAEALEAARRAMARLRQETGALHAYVGPVVLGIAARVHWDRPESDAYLGEAEQLLAAGTLAHSHLWMRREGIDIGWYRRDAEMVRRHAAGLNSTLGSAKVPYVDFLIDRAAVMADYMEGKRDWEWRQRLTRLRGITRQNRAVIFDRTLAEMDSYS